MIVYNLEDVMEKKGISWYKLVKDDVVTKTTQSNFKNGGDISIRKLDELCNFLNCDLTDLVKYAKDDSYLAHWYTLKSKIENTNFDEEFIRLTNSLVDLRNGVILELLTSKHDDSNDKKQDTIKSNMMEVLNMDKLIYDFDMLVKQAKKVNKFERVCYLEKLEQSYRAVIYETNEVMADGSLSKLCNLNNNFCWAEVLDTYLDDWRNEHSREDIDYYDITEYEITQNELDDKEFLELVDAIKSCLDFEIEKFQDSFN